MRVVCRMMSSSSGAPLSLRWSSLTKLSWDLGRRKRNNKKRTGQSKRKKKEERRNERTACQDKKKYISQQQQCFFAPRPKVDTNPHSQQQHSRKNKAHTHTQTHIREWSEREWVSAGENARARRLKTTPSAPRTAALKRTTTKTTTSSSPTSQGRGKRPNKNK